MADTHVTEDTINETADNTDIAERKDTFDQGFPEASARPAAPVPDGVILVSSGTRTAEVSADEFDERGEYIAELVKYIDQISAALEPVRNGLPHDADDFLEPLQAACYLHNAASALRTEMLLQGVTAMMLGHNMIESFTGVSGTTLNRYTHHQPRVDDGSNRRGYGWKDHKWEAPSLPTPPEIPESHAYERDPRVSN
ncbi:hypothetical protein [Corynebacterium sp. AOP12-C2-36]|uniref:hypothetical protein n=1 Tax=Corynebacterium sp. AOP12-C2-36 TaxID=3457723 RepID=UPI0040333387